MLVWGGGTQGLCFLMSRQLKANKLAQNFYVFVFLIINVLVWTPLNPWMYVTCKYCWNPTWTPLASLYTMIFFRGWRYLSLLTIISMYLILHLWGRKSDWLLASQWIGCLWVRRRYVHCLLYHSPCLEEAASYILKLWPQVFGLGADIWAGWCL